MQTEVGEELSKRHDFHFRTVSTLVKERKSHWRTSNIAFSGINPFEMSKQKFENSHPSFPTYYPSTEVLEGDFKS
jgi:hypothetical protein